MAKLHMKRIAAPRTWPILRKERTFIRRPNPGAQSFETGMSINTWLVEVLKVASNSKEARHALKQGKIKVNGKTVKDQNFIVGLLDVISLPEEHYLILLNDRNKLQAFKIDNYDNKKVSKIKNKTIIKKGKKQYTTLEGYNFLDDNDYKIGNTVIINLKDKKIEKASVLEKGKKVYVLKGNSVGKIGTVKEVKDERHVLLDLEGKEILALKESLLIIDDYKVIEELLKE